MADSIVRASRHRSRRDFFAQAGVTALTAWAWQSSHGAEGERPASNETCIEVQPFTEKEFQDSLQTALGPLASPMNSQDVMNLPAAGPVLAAPVNEPQAPSFVPIFGEDNPSQYQLEGAAPQRLALEKAKIWDREKILRWCFVQSPPTTATGEPLGRLIEAAFEEWQSHLQMKIEKVPSSQNAQIKVGFGFKGFWSLVGTDSTANSLLQKYRGQSLNIEPNVRGQNFRAVALHEIGHALGAIHEHQSPSSKIPWDINKLVSYYGRPPNSWDIQQIRYQIINRYSVTQINASEFDRNSIMLYPVSRTLLQDVPDVETFVTGWNTQLSVRDKSFMQQHYGARGGPDKTPDPPSDGQPGKVKRLGDVVPLTLGAPRTDDISLDGGYREYRLTISEPGLYRMETVERNPSTFVVLELFDSSSSTSPRLSNSLDGGRLLNARIDAQLSADTFFVRVRHRHYSGRGTFTIHFTKP